MDDDFLICEDDRCVLLAEDFLDNVSEETKAGRFNRVINDLSKVYPEAVLVGAVAAAKYVRNPDRPRETEDIDVLLGEKDFAEFLIDDIPEEKLKMLNAFFDTSDSLNHSLKHKETGIYVDLLSTESNPIRKRITRHVFENREQSTHILIGDKHSMDILKPELLLAMKTNRFCKDPKSEKALSDRMDMIKILRTLSEKNIPLDYGLVKSFLNEHEWKKLDEIVHEAAGEPLKVQDGKGIQQK
ncbi:MAG: hypothetical protein KKA41_17145 [Proteobacteria bacterium]|nr:hypothetical protein [Pseudomonadota bacterium]